MDLFRKNKLRKYIVALALLAGSAVLNYSWSEESSTIDYERPTVARITTATSTGPPRRPPKKFDVCGRTAGFHRASWSRQQKYYNPNNCPPYDPTKKSLEINRGAMAGRTGNELRAFLRAVQYARDKGVQLTVTQKSWAMKAVLKFFMADGTNNGENDQRRESPLEEGLCLKILPKKTREKMGNRMTNMRLFKYKSKASKEEHDASQLHIMRTLFQHHNTGVDNGGKKVKDMCSGINSLFSEPRDDKTVEVGDTEDHRSSALYSVVHVRYFEGNGKGMLKKAANKTGCDPRAALEMRPEYVKAILAPLGMLAHPVVVISDNQRGSRKVVSRLRADPDLGPLLLSVPKGARWLGGDMTLAVMANVFIGNPSSTMSGFIARSRVALGFEHNYMYMAMDENGMWARVHGVLGEEQPEIVQLA